MSHPVLSASAPPLAMVFPQTTSQFSAVTPCRTTLAPTALLNLVSMIPHDEGRAHIGVFQARVGVTLSVTGIKTLLRSQRSGIAHADCQGTSGDIITDKVLSV
jgi:hypothetical protein